MFKVLTLPLLVSIFIHGLLVAFVLIDMPDSEPLVKKVTPSYIKAELVTLEKTKPEPKPKPTSTKKTPPAKPKQNSSTKSAAKEKAKQLQLAQQKEQARKQEQARRERVEREKAEQERIERERQLREETERELAEAIAAENMQQQSESDQAMAGSYIALISGLITENWSRPPSARNNMEAELILQLVPTGEVVSVTVVKSSGDAAFDESAVRAVKKAERFPELQKVPIRVFEQYFRQLRIKFRPEDLRL